MRQPLFKPVAGIKEDAVTHGRFRPDLNTHDIAE
jgi:hypothetical protein